MPVTRPDATGATLIDSVHNYASGLATPTSICVYDGPPHTDEWFAARGGDNVTATDLPVILGLSRYQNPLSLWARKRGDLPDEEAGEPAQWGLVLEGPIAAEWERRHKARVHPIGVLAHVAAPWQRASLDRQVLRCPDGEGPCGLEVKNRSAFVSGRWREDIPDDVLAQVQWQLHVTGWRHEHLAVLIGGNELRSFRVDRDPVIIEMLVREADAFRRHVLDGTTPPSDHNALLRKVLDALHPDREGWVTAARNTVEALVAERLDAAADVAAANAVLKATKARLEAADAAIVEVLGGGEALAIEGEALPAITYKETARRGYTVEPVTYRSVRVIKKALQ